jgi:large subunit ribosomal protein L24
MKAKFSKSWIKSKQRRKQRKYLANAPLHIKRKKLSANLTKDLRKKYGKRNFPVRKGDEVRVMVGEFKGKTGKITAVDNEKSRVTIENLQRKKKDGSKVNIFFNASNIQIKELELGDKKRLESLNRKTPDKKIKEKKNA